MLKRLILSVLMIALFLPVARATVELDSNSDGIIDDQYLPTIPSLSLNRGDVVGCYGPDDDNKSYVKSGVLNPISGNLNAAVDVIVTTGAGGQTITVSNNSAIYVNDTSGAITYQLPATATGKQFLFRNAATRTGAITISVTTSQYMDKDGVLGTVTTGTLVSGGALGDRAAVYGQDATHWLAETPKGTWTNN